MEEERKHMGKSKDEAIIPVAPSRYEMGEWYFEFINEIKESIRIERLKIVLNANCEMIKLYWNIGKKILEKQKNEGWGSKVIDRLLQDLKDAFPEMQGFSTRNL